MELLLRRYLWVIDLLGIGICSALSGQALATILSAGLVPSVAAPSPHARTARPTAAPSFDKSIDGIVERNIFGSTPGLVSVPEASPRALTLLAVMFAPRPSDARWSVAIVRNDAAATTGAYCVGSRLGDATIAAIEETWLVLDVGRGRRELLELLGRRQDARPEVRRAGLEGVTKTGPHSYEVRRAALNALLARGLTPPTPRVVPLTRNGEAVGLRLSGISADSPFAAIGLISGDVLLDVNGRSLATPAAALEAYTALQTASRVRLSLERDGQRFRMDYELR